MSQACTLAFSAMDTAALRLPARLALPTQREPPPSPITSIPSHPAEPACVLTWRSSSAAVRKVMMLSSDMARHRAATAQPPRFCTGTEAPRERHHECMPAAHWRDKRCCAAQAPPICSGAA